MLNEVGRRLVLKFQTMETLYVAIVTGNIAEVRFLLEAGLAVNAPFSDGLHPLTVAVMHDRDDVAECLLQAGALVNKASAFSTDNLQRQAIHHAAGRGSLGAVRLLLGRGVGVDTPDYGGSSPLHHAAAMGHTEVVKFLLEKGADVNHTSDSGRTTVWKAAQGGFRDLVRFLHEHGATLNQQNKVGASLLHEMARQGRVQQVEDLLALGAGIYARDIVGNNVLHSAASSGCVAAAELLIRAGASVNRVNDNGNSPLHDACNLDEIHVAVCLLNHGAKINTRNAASQTPLYMALLHLHSDVIDLLLSVGAEMTDVDVKMYMQFEVSRWQYKEAFLQRVLQAYYSVRPLTHLCRVRVRALLKPAPRVIEGATQLPVALKRFILLGEFHRW